MLSLDYYNKYKNSLPKIGKTVLIFMVIAILINYFAGHYYNKLITEQELIFVKGTIENRPVIETAGDGDPWVEIRLKEFPGLKFDVGGIKYYAFNAKSFVREVKKGDSLILAILIYDYEGKITRSRQLPLLGQVINYSFIEPYEIHANEKRYLSLNNVNEALKENALFAYWLSIVIIILSIIYLIADLSGAVDRFSKWYTRLQDNL